LRKTAVSFRDAILRHRAEAFPVRLRFQKLSAEDKEAFFEFLRSL